MIWMQSREGRAIDLVDPDPAQVDFVEIARTLGRINRYAGASLWPVSVALHTLIACDAAPEELRPWVLLHDAHEAYIGDITTPVAQALAFIASRNRDIFGAGLIVEDAIEKIKLRHDDAIHARACLPMPTPEQKAAIRRADIVALQTERRDFLMPGPKPWHPEIEAVAPLEKSYLGHIPIWRAALQADELIERFRAYLPAAAFNPYPV